MSELWMRGQSVDVTLRRDAVAPGYLEYKKTYDYFLHGSTASNIRLHVKKEKGMYLCM